MTRLSRHVLTVVAALFALAVGIALGGGPLSYVSDDDPGAATGRQESDEEESQGPDEPGARDGDGVAEAFLAGAAARLYDGALRGHPTVIVAMPGVDSALVDTMVDQVAVAGGGVTGVFEVTDQAVDRDESSLVDSLGSRLMTQLGDERVDPTGSTYVRLGQLVSMAVATPKGNGRRADAAAQTIRASLDTGGLLTSPEEARLAPLVLVLLPPHDDARTPEVSASQSAVYLGLTSGLRRNAAGMVVLGDTASGEGGLLTELRRDELLSGTVATVDGGETVVGQVTAMMALIDSLEARVGAYGASGSDGALPVS